MAVEYEKKYRVYGLVEDNLVGKCEVRELEQFYLDYANDNLKMFVVHLFGKDYDVLTNMAEARIRVVNGQRYLLTVKSNGGMERQEFETELCDIVAEDLIENYAISKIRKTRYDCPVVASGNIVEIDFYKDRDLVVAEMEFDPYELTEDEIDKQVRGTLNAYGKPMMVVDVTGDKNYKNAHLALPISQQENE